MSSSRTSPLYLLALGLVLGGLAGYLGYSLVMGGDSPLLVYPEREPGELVEPAPVPDPASAEAGPAVRVTIELQPKARLEPAPAGQPVRVRTGDEGDEWQVPEARFLAGPAAVQQDALGRSLVRCTLRSGETIERLVERLVPGHVELRVLGPFPVVGRVRDQRGDPILGASVYLGGARTTTDEQGEFRFERVLGGDAVPFAATAPDHAGRMRVLELDAATAAAPLELWLERGVALQVQHAARAVPGTARAFVLPVPGDADTRLLQYPFFLQALDGGVAVDESGTATIDGLPRDVRVRVVVDHPWQPAVAPVTVQLRAEVSRATVAAREAPLLTGRVVDERGAPLAGVLVASGLAGASARDAYCLPAVAYLGGSHAFSGADGAFSLARIGGRRGSLIRWSAPGRQAVTLEVAPVAEAVDVGAVVLPPASELRGEPELRVRLLDRGRSLQVRVLVGGVVVRSWTPWRDRDAYVVPLREPAVVDLRIAVEGGAVLERRGLAVGGSLEVTVDG